MIRNSTINSVLPLTKKLLDNGISLSAIGSTPLGLATQKSYSPVAHNSEFFNSGDNDLRVWAVSETLRTPNTFGFSEHCETVDDIRKTLAGAVGNHLSYVRNVVNPQIMTLIELVHQAQETTEMRIGSTMSIVQDEWDPIWENPILATLVEPGSMTALNPEITIPRVHPMLSDEQIRELMNTGADRFDKEIQEWIDNIGVKFITDTYNWNFVTDADTGQITRDFDQVNWLLGTDPWSRKQSIVIFLLVKGLRNKLQVGIDMDEVTYQNAMSEVQAQAGRAVSRCIDQRIVLKKSRSIILDWPVRGRDHITTAPELSQILVNTDVYNEWLEAGGQPEILFGSAITDRETVYEELLTRGPQYIEAWRRHEAIIRSGQRSELFNVARDTISIETAKMIAEIKQEELEGRDRNTMLTKLRDEIYMISVSDIADIAKVCCRVVANTIHYHTDAYMILCMMADTSRNNPDLPAREVATITAIDILSKWFVDQIVIRRT